MHDLRTLRRLNLEHCEKVSDRNARAKLAQMRLSPIDGEPLEAMAEEVQALADSLTDTGYARVAATCGRCGSPIPLYGGLEVQGSPRCFGCFAH